MTPGPTIAAIQAATAVRFGVPLIEMRSERRARSVARPRQVAMYLAKQLTLASLPKIGREFGGRDHSTVAHAVNQVERLMAEDLSFALRVAVLRAELQLPWLFAA